MLFLALNSCSVNYTIPMHRGVKVLRIGIKKGVGLSYASFLGHNGKITS